MKKNLLAALLAISTMFCLNTKTNAQILIDYWNFNVDSTTVLVPTSSRVPGTGLAYSGAYYDTVQPGTTVNGVGADGSSLTSGSAALRLRNPATGPFTLTLPTTNYKNIVLKYAEERTNKGSQSNTVTYTVDGSTWINTAIATTATYTIDSTDSVTNAFQLETFDFSSDPLVNNNPNFKVQITFSVGDTNSSGNDRFDNITLYGDTSATTGITTITSTPAYVLYPNPAASSLTVSAATAGEKAVIITDVAGAVIYKGTQAGVEFSINTSDFAAGDYFISITEKESGKATAMKFVKQ